MKTSEVLKAAKDLIIKYGWIRHSSGNTEVGFCIYGALNMIGSKNNFQYPFDAHSCIITVLREDSKINENEGVVEYNDTIAKSENDILEVFNRAIQIAHCKEKA